MYYFKYKNLNIKIDATAEDMGFMSIKLPEEFVLEMCGAELHDLDDDPYYECDQGIVYLEEMITNSPDLAISYFSHLLEEGEEVNIECEYSHPFWCVHDLLHATHDESGCIVYVDADIEAQRLLDTFNLIIEGDKNWDINDSFVQEIEEAYKKRFDKSIDLLSHFRDLVPYEIEEIDYYE